MQTDAQYYEKDEKVEISKSLLLDLIDAAGFYRMMYNDWVAGTTPENHPDLNAVEYLLGEADRIREYVKNLIIADWERQTKGESNE